MGENPLNMERGRVEGRIVHRMQRICSIEAPGPCSIIIFGASGDLTHRKILPALYHLHITKLLPKDFFVLGAARSSMTEEAFRDSMKDAVKNVFPDDLEDTAWSAFSERLYFRRIDYEEIASYKSLGEVLDHLERRHETKNNRIFYLAVPPTAYETAIRNIGEAGLSEEEGGYSHLVIEKPFGRDLESSLRLNAVISRSFKEHQVYRMDHYLAKETVQNILMFRFANSIFEPLWNRRYIDHVQITVSETLGVEHRAGYYENAGVIRDMFQNHIFQLLSLTAMEPPSLFEAERVRDERVKVLCSVRPFPTDRIEDHLAIGQYDRGTIDGIDVQAYRDEPGVSHDSKTPTFAAMKIFIDNWRWNGVPFYLRSGKRLSARKAEISVHFREVPHMMFHESMREGIEPNTLVLRIQPDEGIGLSLQTKNPGSRVCLNTVQMDFSYQKLFMTDAYERVLLDCMQGDRMLFVRSDAVEEAWAILTPLLERLETGEYGEAFPNYASGSEGPAVASALIEKDGRSWRPIRLGMQ